MTIEVTEEMTDAMRRVLQPTPFEPTIVRAIEEVLAIVERDHEIGPKLCGDLRYPDDPDFTYEKCEEPPGHSGRHKRYIENDGWESWA